MHAEDCPGYTTLQVMEDRGKYKAVQERAALQLTSRLWVDLSRMGGPDSHSAMLCTATLAASHRGGVCRRGPCFRQTH